MIEQDELITAGEAARIAGVSRQRINELASLGRLGRQVAGRYWVFTREEVEAYKHAPKNKGGRPKEGPSQTMENRTPALAAY
jgi:excisionase family DNA binding protein